MAPTGPESEAAEGCSAAGRGWRGEALDTARLRLRRLVPADATEVARQAGQPEVALPLAGWQPRSYDEAAARAYLDEAEGRMARGEAVLLGLERRTDKALLGCVGLNRDDGYVRLGYWLGIDHWHQGYATEAVRRMARLAFAALGMTELRAGVLADNPGSARVLAKLGFEEVGGTGAVRDFRLGAADWRARHRA